MELKRILATGLACALPLWPAAATAQGYDILVENLCPDEMRVALRHAPPGGDWKTASWYTIAPGTRTYLTASGQRLQHGTFEHNVGIYAETRDGRGMFGLNDLEEKSSANYVFKLRDDLFVVGREADMRNVNGDIYIPLTCYDQ